MRLAVLVLSALLVIPTADAVATTTPEEELLWLVNETRTEHGLPPLEWRDDVAAVAESHSERMRASGSLHHNDAFFTDAARSAHGSRAHGENVAHGGSMQAVHDAIMDSQEHRAVLLDPRWRGIWIGVVLGSDRFWVTEDFVEPR